MVSKLPPGEFDGLFVRVKIIPLTLEEEYHVTVLLVGGEFVAYLHGKVKGRMKTNAASISAFELDAPTGTAIWDQVRLRRKE